MGAACGRGAKPPAGRAAAEAAWPLLESRRTLDRSDMIDRDSRTGLTPIR
jgi:hypothetical protein